MKKIYLKTFQIAFLLLVALFIGKVISTNWQEIAKYKWSLNFPYLVLSFLLLLVHAVSLSIAWQQLVLLIGGKLSIRTAYKITVLSAIARYLPGGIWDHVGKFTLAKKEYGIEGKCAFLSVVLNIVLSVLTAVIVFLLSLIFFSRYQNLKLLPYLATLIPLGLVAIYPPLLERVVNFVLPKLGRRRLELPFSYLQILKSTVWFFLSWAAIGSSLFFLIYAFSPVNVSFLPAIIGIFAISWVVGFLTPIAPTGAGVREASLILLLGALVPMPIAIISALSSRLLIIGGDLVSAAIGAKL